MHALVLLFSMFTQVLRQIAVSFTNGIHLVIGQHQSVSIVAEVLSGPLLASFRNTRKQRDCRVRNRRHGLFCSVRWRPTQL